jgi:hypothetical protein
MGYERNSYRIVVYTDDPTAFGGLAVHIEPVSDQLLADWAGPFDFNHRRKIFVVKDALQKFGGRLVYCDADTYFIKHPRKLFARIRPGHTVMHIREYHLYDYPARELAASLGGRAFQNLAGQPWNITPCVKMFNAGVIGLHEADISLLDEVVHLTDQMYSHIRLHTIEQFAFSICLQHRTTLHQSDDIIHHYWPPAGRTCFREKLGAILHDPLITSDEDRLHKLSPHRPTIHRHERINELCRSMRSQIRYELSQAADRLRMKSQLKQVAKWAGMSH